MPYITANRREAFLELEGKLLSSRIDTVGEMTYIITQVFLKYVAQHGLKFQAICDCAGASECAKMELYRRVGAKYEDGKCAENGDVYDIFEGGTDEDDSIKVG